MKTLLLCLLAASLGAGDVPTGWFVKCDTSYVWVVNQDSSWATWETREIITCDTTWIYPVVVDTIVRCDTVPFLRWIQHPSEDTFYSRSPDFIYERAMIANITIESFDSIVCNPEVMK
jgi:hypothetical protein